MDIAIYFNAEPQSIGQVNHFDWTWSIRAVVIINKTGNGKDYLDLSVWQIYVDNKICTHTLQIKFANNYNKSILNGPPVIEYRVGHSPLSTKLANKPNNSYTNANLKPLTFESK